MTDEATVPADPTSAATPEFDDQRLRFSFLPDRWRCLLIGGLSGRYGGKSSSGRQRIDLRVDLDRRHPNSPVLDRISADVFAHYSFNWFGRSFEWDVYQHSWIIDSPARTGSGCSATISGTARRYDSGDRFPVEIGIRWQYGRITGATCRLDPTGRDETYACTLRSRHFRDLTLEVDVASSVNNEPIEPAYDVSWHSNRPPAITPRVLTVEEAFREAGIDVELNDPGDRTVIDDSNSQFTTWTDDELHDAMETHFSLYSGRWPAWRMWFLVCGSYTSSGTGGIMFDYSGPGEPPERQGCAIFRNHRWWNDLVDGTPSGDAEAAANRKWLHTWIHEIGHGLNYVHSWNKNAPDDLSWMNYDWRYDNRNGRNSYFANFDFRFSDDELLHLRHGDRRAVIPGGDAWATGRHAHDGSTGADATVEGDAPVEVLVRSKTVFDYLEPVRIEVRLRNTTAIGGGPGMDLDIDGALSPEHGTIGFVIRRPDGRTVSYRPPMCRLGTEPDRVTLQAPGALKGLDRYSVELPLGLGADGFYFDEPGTYLIRAVWESALGVTLPSAVHRIRIARPADQRIERLAGDLFRRDAGLAMYFGGSASAHLASGMDTVRATIDELPVGSARAQLAYTIAPTFTEQRFRVNDKLKVVRARPAEPDEALALMDIAVETQAEDAYTLSSITEHHLHRHRATVMAKSGQKTEAKRDLARLAKRLVRAGVNQPVIDDLTGFSKSL